MALAAPPALQKRTEFLLMSRENACPAHLNRIAVRVQVWERSVGGTEPVCRLGPCSVGSCEAGCWGGPDTPSVAACTNLVCGTWDICLSVCGRGAQRLFGVYLQVLDYALGCC